MSDDIHLPNSDFDHDRDDPPPHDSFDPDEYEEAQEELTRAAVQKIVAGFDELSQVRGAEWARGFLKWYLGQKTPKRKDHKTGGRQRNSLYVEARKAYENAEPGKKLAAIREYAKKLNISEESMRRWIYKLEQEDRKREWLLSQWPAVKDAMDKGEPHPLLIRAPNHE